jgi:DNA polymerase sigma
LFVVLIQICNVNSFLIEYSIAQRGCYSCDMKSMRQSERDISSLFAKFLPFCDGNQNYDLWELFATVYRLYSE